MLAYDPLANLQHYPTAVRRFGLNPFGEPEFRIVFAPSRRYLVCGEWPDGSNRAQWVVKHKNLGNVWIMERWVSAEQYAGCSPDNWNAGGGLILGPYPARGEYELCWTFDTGVPDGANLDDLVDRVKKRFRLSELRTYHRDQTEKTVEDNRKTAEDMIRSKLPAFGGRVLASSRIARGTKTMPELRSAEELGLPTKPGLRAIPKRQKAA